MTTPENKQQTLALQAESPGFHSGIALDLIQRVAKVFTSSTMVPARFRNSFSDTVIALEIAQRLGASPMAVMQSLYVVDGQPGWSAAFMIAAANATRRFSAIRYTLEGEGDTRTCVAHALEVATGEPCVGPAVSIGMAKAEGWATRKGSKWVNMPEIMLRYRAATLWVRLYCPEILLGIKTIDEIEDIAVASKARKVEAKVIEKPVFAPAPEEAPVDTTPPDTEAPIDVTPPDTEEPVNVTPNLWENL